MLRKDALSLRCGVCKVRQRQGCSFLQSFCVPEALNYDVVPVKVVRAVLLIFSVKCVRSEQVFSRLSSFFQPKLSMLLYSVLLCLFFVSAMCR